MRSIKNIFMRSIETIFDILTFPFWLMYLGFSAAIFTYFEMLEDDDYPLSEDEWADEDCEPTSDKKDSP